MTTVYKFNGKNSKGLYDFVSCVATNKTIDEVQAYIESKGWTNLEFVNSHKPNGYEEYSFNS